MDEEVLIPPFRSSSYALNIRLMKVVMLFCLLQVIKQNLEGEGELPLSALNTYIHISQTTSVFKDSSDYMYVYMLCIPSL